MCPIYVLCLIENIATPPSLVPHEKCAPSKTFATSKKNRDPSSSLVVILSLFGFPDSYSQSFLFIDGKSILAVTVSHFYSLMVSLSWQLQSVVFLH
jgi:hypothetical protein